MLSNTLSATQWAGSQRGPSGLLKSVGSLRDLVLSFCVHLHRSPQGKISPAGATWLQDPDLKSPLSSADLGGLWGVGV